MGYTREQRAANAAKAAEAAAKAVSAPVESQQSPEPSSDSEPSQEQLVVRNKRERQMSERSRIMEELAAKTMERGGITDQEAESKPSAVESPQPPPDKPEINAEATPEAPAAVEPPKTSKQVVDGREYEVPLSEIEDSGGERAWRKDKAATNRLEEAKAALAESRRTQAAITQWAQSQIPQQPQVSPDQLLQQHVELIRNGTPEQSAAALRAVIQSSIPQVNPVEIQNTAVFKMRQDMAAAQFKAEFPEIAANPTLLEFAGVKENAMLPRALQSLGITSMADPRVPHFDFGQFYRSIGNEIRSAFPRQSQPQADQAITPAGTPSPAKSEREERKSSIVNLPTAAARAETPAEPKPETREEILAAMRKARGKIS